MKILTCFNSYCGATERPEQILGYIDGISSILMQQGIYQDVVWSSCLNSPPCRSKVMDIFEDNIYYCFIDELHPISVTFNLSALKMTELRDEPYDLYLYIDSGIRFLDENQLKILTDIHIKNKSGMTSAMVDLDSGIFEGLKWGKHIDDHTDIDKYFENGIYQIKLGQAISIHCQLFDKEIYTNFNRLCGDIFAGHALETVFSHICASIGKKNLLTNKVLVHHLPGMDGGAAGFSPADWVRKGNDRLDQPYKIDSIFRVMREGQKYGLGYVEWYPQAVKTDMSKFDENGFALDPQLKHYIKDNIFLSKELLDYNKIKCDLIRL